MQRPNPFLSLGRRAPRLTILSLFVLALVLCADALAASRNFVVESGARRPADRLALVIGNDYAGESGHLENPLNDADDMRQALAKLGFEVMGANRLRLEDMTRLVRQFGDRLRPGMVGLFYFAGHGMQINGQNYLIPMQSGIEREDEVPFRALAVDQVLAKMSHNQTGLNLLMLDACRDNPFARTFRGNTTGLARMNAPAGTLIAYAAKPGTRSKDGSGRNGLYTGVLLKYLPIPGLPIEQMLKKVGAEVRQRSGDTQQTWMEGLLDSGDGGDFCFAGCGGAPTQSTPPYRPIPKRETAPTAVTPAPKAVPMPDVHFPSLNDEAKWDLCARKIFEYWEKKGLADYGDSSAYIGAGGASQNAQILEQCGRRPTTRSQRGTALSPQDCNDSYVQVYLNCLSKPDFLQTNLAQSYIKFLDPRIFDEARLASLCQDSKRIDRQNYGILMCGE